MKCLLNLGMGSDYAHADKKKRTLTDRMGRKWDLWDYGSGLKSWCVKPRDNPGRFVVYRFGRFWVGRTFSGFTNDLVFEVTAGPFKQLRVAKVAYLMEG